jgi:hypothetical protein
MCILIGHTCVFYMSTISQVTLCIHDNYQINIFQFSLVKVATEANIIMFQYLDSLGHNYCVMLDDQVTEICIFAIIYFSILHK